MNRVRGEGGRGEALENLARKKGENRDSKGESLGVLAIC